MVTSWCASWCEPKRPCTSRSTSTCSTHRSRRECSSPEPGGLSYRQLRSILIEVARRGRVIGFDVVELNPARDPSGVTSRAAAWLIAHFLSEIFDQPCEQREDSVEVTQRLDPTGS